MKNILGYEMTPLPPNDKRCTAERWGEKESPHIRCEYLRGHPGDHFRATASWAFVWPQEQP